MNAAVVVPSKARATTRMLGVSLLGLLLMACAAPALRPIPDAIRSPPPGDLQLVEARQEPRRHTGARVRWGGTVIAVDRDAAGSVRLQVLERRLDADGRPVPGSPSDGRFIVEAAPATDPTLYASGADVTVNATLVGVVEARVGDTPTPLPVVRTDELMLWERRWPVEPYYQPGLWSGPRVRFGVGVSDFHQRLRRHDPGAD